MSSGPVRVVMVDDHALVLDAVARLVALEPDMAVVATAGTLGEAMDAVVRTGPHVLVTDLQMGGGGEGWELIRWAHRLRPRPGIVVLSMFDGPEFRERARRMGAQAYVAKDAAPQVLVDAVRQAARVPEHAALALPDTDPLGPAHLTRRETEVFGLLGRGLTTRQIARTLGISAKTVETHRGRVMRKLGLSNIHQLVRRAVLWLHDRDPAKQA